MRACEFMTAEDGIAFLKFMIDKTWYTIKTEAKKKAEREENIRKTKQAKPKSKKPHKKKKTKKLTLRPPKLKKPKSPIAKKMAKKKPAVKKKVGARAGLDAKHPIPTKKPLKPIPVSVAAGRPLRDKSADTTYLDN